MIIVLNTMFNIIVVENLKLVCYKGNRIILTPTLSFESFYIYIYIYIYFYSASTIPHSSNSITHK